MAFDMYFRFNMFVSFFCMPRTIPFFVCIICVIFSFRVLPHRTRAVFAETFSICHCVLFIFVVVGS